MTAFDVDHGILGLEGIHRINNRIDINVQSGWPRIELDRITGLHGLPDVDDNREPSYGRSGERTYLGFVRGKTIVYEGRVLGRDLYQLREHTHELRQAINAVGASARSKEGEIVVRPHPAIGGLSHRYEARFLAFDCDDEQNIGVDAMPTAYQRSFVLTVRQSDPRYYVVGADVTVSGAEGEIKTVDNIGNASALPVFTISGPFPLGELEVARLNNVAERRLVYDGITGVPAGDALRLDFRDRSLRRVSDDASYEHHRIFNDSNWWDPGAAPLNQGESDVVVLGGSGWTINFSPASW
jgi:hypothetical protein